MTKYFSYSANVRDFYVLAKQSMLKVNFRRIDSREKKHVIGEFKKSRSWPRKVLLR